MSNRKQAVTNRRICCYYVTSVTIDEHIERSVVTYSEKYGLDVTILRKNC